MSRSQWNYLCTLLFCILYNLICLLLFSEKNDKVTLGYKYTTPNISAMTPSQIRIYQAFTSERNVQDIARAHKLACRVQLQIPSGRVTLSVSDCRCSQVSRWNFQVAMAALFFKLTKATLSLPGDDAPKLTPATMCRKKKFGRHPQLCSQDIVTEAFSVLALFKYLMTQDYARPSRKGN